MWLSVLVKGFPWLLTDLGSVATRARGDGEKPCVPAPLTPTPTPQKQLLQLSGEGRGKGGWRFRLWICFEGAHSHMFTYVHE